jgi:DNA invertase Pin-like site-specific DNA recombinase
MNEKIRAQHLERKAIIYIRQSSAYQVTHNLESQKLQYAMQDRVRQFGWREIEVIDEDLGRSASGSVERSGFERMVAEVCMGKVGAVAAREVSRFARNSKDWQQLVEVCRIVDTLLIDQETVYAPRQSNDRLLLGLKGSLNEYELELLRQRSVEARYEKARRGELLVAAPIGYIKTEDQRLEKNPDRRVQEAIALIFRKFQEIGSVRQTLMWFLEHGLQLLTQTARGELLWRRPSYRALYRIMTSPVYGGAYAYGKTEQILIYESGEPRRRHRRKPRARWLALIPNSHEGYISWEEFQQIQETIRENVSIAEGAGAAKRGAALLSGLLRCRRCGRKLTVRYTGNRHDVLRYTCNRSWLDNGEPRCIAFGGIAVDEAIGKQVLQVVQPAAVDAAVLAGQQEAHRRDDVVEALRRDLEAARYTVQRAQRQYDGTDPENRLVASELERRWNQALQRVSEIETRIQQHLEQTSVDAAPTTEEFMDLAKQLETVWNDPDTDVRLKKRIVRTLIDEVIADVNNTAGEIILMIHWRGDLHTEVRLHRRRRGQNKNQTPKTLVETVVVLARICSDDFIAGMLNRHGLKTGRGNYWTRERVAALRNDHRIPCYDAEKRERDGWLNLTAAASVLGLSPRTVRLAVERGEISAEHPLTNGPWVFHRSSLDTEAVRALVRRAHSGKQPAVPAVQQESFDFSGT